MSQAPFEHQELSSLAWHSGGRRGRWEAAFNFISAWEKFPFMWLPVISPGGSAEGGGVQRGAGGGVAAWGTLAPCTTQTVAPPEPFGGGEGPPWGVGAGSLSGRGHLGRRPLPAPRLAAGSTQAADGLGQPSLACLQVWGGRLWCQPQGGDAVTQPACTLSCANPQSSHGSWAHPSTQEP